MRMPTDLSPPKKPIHRVLSCQITRGRWIFQIPLTLAGTNSLSKPDLRSATLTWTTDSKPTLALREDQWAELCIYRPLFFLNKEHLSCVLLPAALSQCATLLQRCPRKPASQTSEVHSRTILRTAAESGRKLSCTICKEPSLVVCRNLQKPWWLSVGGRGGRREPLVFFNTFFPYWWRLNPGWQTLHRYSTTELHLSTPNTLIEKFHIPPRSIIGSHMTCLAPTSVLLRLLKMLVQTSWTFRSSVF